MTTLFPDATGPRRPAGALTAGVPGVPGRRSVRPPSAGLPSPLVRALGDMPLPGTAAPSAASNRSEGETR